MYNGYSLGIVPWIFHTPERGVPREERQFVRSLGFVAGNLHKSACYSFSLDFFLKEKKGDNSPRRKFRGSGEEELRVAVLFQVSFR